jgi:hypothetical protein
VHRNGTEMTTALAVHATHTNTHTHTHTHTHTYMQNTHTNTNAHTQTHTNSLSRIQITVLRTDGSLSQHDQRRGIPGHSKSVLGLSRHLERSACKFTYVCKANTEQYSCMSLTSCKLLASAGKDLGRNRDTVDEHYHHAVVRLSSRINRRTAAIPRLRMYKGPSAPTPDLGTRAGPSVLDQHNRTPRPLCEPSGTMCTL